ncbi:MAG TPA: response regulator transcription factor [Nitrospira sp.]|nr:response regulator transcription factor [Nitrospira sp.]
MKYRTLEDRRADSQERSTETHSIIGSPHRYPILVVIAGSTEIMRAGLRAFLQGEESLKVVAETDTAGNLLSTVQQCNPDIVLIESPLVRGTDADICKTLLSAFPSIRIILIGSGDGHATFHKALEAGAQGFLLTNVRRVELVQAIHTVAKGVPYLCSEAVTETFRLLRRQQNGSPITSPVQALSRQERRIIALIAEGCTNKEIALKLILSEKTVKNYIANLYTKLEIERRSQAAAIYVKAQFQDASMGSSMSA